MSGECHVTVSVDNCTPTAVKVVEIHTIVFLALVVLAALGYAIAVVRRWLLLREPFNTFWVMNICTFVFHILTITTYGLLLDETLSTRRHPGIAFTFWWSLVVLGNTFGPLVAAWLRLSSTTVVSQNKMVLSDWPRPLLCAWLFFNLVAFVTCVLMCWPQYFNIALQVLAADWSIWFWACSASLYYGARKIKRLVSTLAVPQRRASKSDSLQDSSLRDTRSVVSSEGENEAGTESSIDTRPTSSKSSPSSPKVSSKQVRPYSNQDSVTRVVRTLDRVLIFVVLLIFLPCSVTTTLQAIFQSWYIDSHTWCIELIMALYRFFSIAYSVFWGCFYWFETNHRYQEIMDSRPSVSA